MLQAPRYTRAVSIDRPTSDPHQAKIPNYQGICQGYPSLFQPSMKRGREPKRTTPVESADGKAEPPQLMASRLEEPRVVVSGAFPFLGLHIDPVTRVVSGT